MIRWIKAFKESSRETKLFIFNWVLYSLLMIISTAYVYGRLDFVRSYKTTTNETSNQNNQN